MTIQTVRWEKLSGGGIHLKTNIPAGIQARIEISLPQREIVLEIGSGSHNMKLE